LTNLLQIVSEIAKAKPIIASRLTIARCDLWDNFSKKVVLWIFMVHNFSYRLSALVQVLMDFEQKKLFNAKSSEYSYRRCHGNKVEELNGRPYIEDMDKLLVHYFYQKYVEKYIHIFKQSERLSRVDKDPEEFAFLLSQCDLKNMKCEDILGPKSSSDSTERQKDFSLLSYSFNLDPAMRMEVLKNKFDSILL